MERPVLNSFNELAEVSIQLYEHYLPTAFNSGLTLTQKVNKIIVLLNQMGKLNNDVVKQWNEVMEWILNGGMEETIVARLNEMATDGTLDSIINQTIFGDIQTRLSKLESDFVIASDFGAMGDSTIQTIKLQNAIEHLKTLGGGKLYLPKGTYVVDGLVIYSNIHLMGDGDGLTKLVKQNADNAGTEDMHLITGTDCSNVTIEGISFIHQNGSTTLRCELIKFLSSVATNYTKNIRIKNCSFQDTLNGRSNLVLFSGLVKDIFIESNIFNGFTNTTVSSSVYGLKFDNISYLHTENDFVNIHKNMFLNNKRGVGFEGTGYAPNILMSDNLFRGQTERALMIYHGLRYNIHNNHFEDITAVASSNNDGGAVWLDVHSPDVTPKSCIFSNNTLQDIIGNAILLEEFWGMVVDNEITNVSKRSGLSFSTVYDYESVQTTVASDGGNGIHVTGGCQNFIISGNKIRNIANEGINIDRALGIQKTGLVSGTISDNVIDSTGNGIGLYEKISEIKIKGNDIKSGTSAVRITRRHNTANNLLDRLVIIGNEMKGTNGISKSYGLNNYGYFTSNVIQHESAGAGIAFAYNLGSSSNNMVINNSTKAVTVA